MEVILILSQSKLQYQEKENTNYYRVWFIRDGGRLSNSCHDVISFINYLHTKSTRYRKDVSLSFLVLIIETSV